MQVRNIILVILVIFKYAGGFRGWGRYNAKQHQYARHVEFVDLAFDLHRHLKLDLHNHKEFHLFHNAVVHEIFYHFENNDNRNDVIAPCDKNTLEA